MGPLPPGIAFALALRAPLAPGRLGGDWQLPACMLTLVSLVGLLVGVGMRRMGGRAGAALGLLLALGYAPVAEAQTVSVPNTLTNGSVAEADAMNANFEAVRTGVNLALTSADVTGLTQFTNGTTADAPK